MDRLALSHVSLAFVFYDLSRDFQADFPIDAAAFVSVFVEGVFGIALVGGDFVVEELGSAVPRMGDQCLLLREL